MLSVEAQGQRRQIRVLPADRKSEVKSPPMHPARLPPKMLKECRRNALVQILSSTVFLWFLASCHVCCVSLAFWRQGQTQIFPKPSQTHLATFLFICVPTFHLMHENIFICVPAFRKTKNVSNVLFQKHCSYVNPVLTRPF